MMKKKRRGKKTEKGKEIVKRPCERFKKTIKIDKVTPMFSSAVGLIVDSEQLRSHKRNESN